MFFRTGDCDSPCYQPAGLPGFAGDARLSGETAGASPKGSSHVSQTDPRGAQAAGTPGPGAPDETVRALYAADAPFINNTGQGVTGSKKLMARFLSKALDKLLDDDAKAADKRGEPPTIEGDPFVDSQEGGSKDFKISVLSASADKAQVLANFDKDGVSREDVTYSLILERGQWRIDDIAYKRADGSAETIREILKGK